MPTYESSGSLTTIEKSYPSPQTPDLSGLVYTLNGQSVSVDVVGSPGQAGEEIVTQSLGGASSYGLTWNSAHTSFEVVFNLSTADTSTTPQVDDLTLQGQPLAPEITVSEVTDTPDISLSWPSVSTADEYRIYRATSPGSTLADYTLLDTTTTTGYTDTTPTLGTRYYYVVTAYNTSTGESEPSNEVRAAATDDYTNSIEWDLENEWQYGAFTDTSTDGSGALQLADATTISFNYSMSIPVGGNTASATVTIRDANTSDTLATDSITGSGTERVEQTGEFLIDVDAHPSIEFEAAADTSSGESADASISGPVDGSTVTLVSVSIGESTSATDTRTESYAYHPVAGSWTSEYWDFTNTTTATKLSWSGVTLPNAGDDVTVTVENSDGTSTSSVSLTAGSGSTLFEISPDDQYRLVVDVSTADDDTTPEVDSLTLEAHTPVDGHTITDSRETEQDLAWNPIGVCDGYEVYQSESTPVEVSDTLAYSNTDNTVTSATITGLENGERYYYNVRPVYSGE